MNKLNTYLEVKAEAERFLERIDRCIEDEKHYENAKLAGEKWPDRPNRSGVRSGAMKRASMDLTRALVRVR